MFSNSGAREDLRIPWTARRSNQSILKEINPKYSLEGLILKLKFLFSGHLIRRADLLEKTDEKTDTDRRQKKRAAKSEMVR